MVSHPETSGNNGARNWLLLRVSAIIITLYLIYIAVFFLKTEAITWQVWRGFVALSVTKVFTLLTLLSLLVHCWIGLWQVLTDYVRAPALRLFLQWFVMLLLLLYILYGMVVIGSV